MDIFKMALVIIYPDGYVDPIPIREGVYSHVEYFYEYLKKSSRFQCLVRDNHFSFDWRHDSNSHPICKLLVQNGIIVFYNTAIYDVLYNIDNAKNSSFFAISFPRDYEGLPSIPFVKEIVKELQDQQFELEKFRTDKDDFEPFDSDENEKFLEKNKQNKEKEIKL